MHIGGFPEQQRFRHSGRGDDVFWSMLLHMFCGKVMKVLVSIVLSLLVLLAVVVY